MRARNAIILTVFLLVQVASNSFVELQIDSDVESNLGMDLDFSFMSGNNSLSNHTGGNNTGGNNTGGNNTGGNNTGGNNTGGNNTGGNNTQTIVRLIIDSVALNSVNDRITLTYHSENYSGFVSWEYNSTNGTSTTSSYANSWTRTAYIYPDTFGVIQICGTISNPAITECTSINREVRLLEGGIIYPSNNYSTTLSSISLYYSAHNYSHGFITVNAQLVETLPSYHNQTANGSSSNSTSWANYSTIVLPSGWSTFCLQLEGDNNTMLTDCIQVYRTPPVIRFIIDSVTLSSSNDLISLTYHSENYSGYVTWEYNSSNGTSTSPSSYTDNYIRQTHIYPVTFGVIQICGTIGNSTTDCVSVNRVARIVEGALVAPTNNSQFTTNYIEIFSWSNNYSNGMITVNGVNVDWLGSSFNHNGSWSAYYNSSSTYLYLSYGFSTICLELEGENGVQLSDCIIVERIIPHHSVSITYPAAGASFTGQQLNLGYVLENSSAHHFTVDGTVISALNTSSNSNAVQISVGYGTRNVCVVSYDFANQIDSACITVNMVNPNADSDSDGVPDHSDICQNTPANLNVNADGCSASQLDSDGDGITDNLDLCPSTQQSSNVDASGCSASQRDSDGDGVFDSNDMCPSTPVNSVVDSDGCTNSQTDSDNDGVMDDLDLCPSTFFGSQVDANGCAPSQLDSDSDGIVDSFDQCPSTAIGTVVDQTGCAYSNSSNNPGNSTGGSSGSGSSSSSGLPGFEAVYLLISVIFAIFVMGRKKSVCDY